MEEQETYSEKIPEKPELYADLIPIWECFQFLSPARPIGMELGAIPLSEIVAYWKDVVGVLSQDDLKEKVSLVRAVDEEYLKIMREKHSGF